MSNSSNSTISINNLCAETILDRAHTCSIPGPGTTPLTYIDGTSGNQTSEESISETYFGSVPLETVIELVKEKYPENFI